MFDQLKMAREMMKNMSPEQIKDLMEQAKASQGALAEQIQTIVNQEIERRQLISRAEVERMIQERLKSPDTTS